MIIINNILILIFHGYSSIIFILVYTSLAYSGPPIVKKLNRELANLMK